MWPWRVSGQIAAAATRRRSPTPTCGSATRRARSRPQGRLSLAFGGRPRSTADLKAKTLNIDALLRKDKETFVPPARAAQAFAALLGAGARPRCAAVEILVEAARAEAAYLGARTLGDAEAYARRRGRQPRAAQVRERPAGTRARGARRRRWSSRPAPIFRGRGQGAVGDFASLAAWIAEGEPALARRLAGLAAALPQGDISASGDVELSPEGYSVRGLTLGVAASRFDGSIVYRLPSAERTAGGCYLDLASDALDIEAAPNVEAGLDWLGDADLDFRLKADTLRVARIGLASVSGGSLEVRATKEGRKFTLEKLSLADLGGASIEAEGESSPSGRWTRVQLDAGRLGDFAALLARAAPGAADRVAACSAPTISAPPRRISRRGATGRRSKGRSRSISSRRTGRSPARASR